MAALTASFEADFSSFYDACKQAVVELKSFETGASQVEDKLDRMTNKFSGQKVIQDAQLMAEAIERLGGVSTLTEAELARVGRVANEAVEKMQALGMDVPKGMEELAAATKGAGDSTESLSVSVGNLAASYITAEAAIKLAEMAYAALVDSVKAVIAAASEGEEAESGLLAALKAQGTAVPSVVAAYDDYAKALQQTTIYSDTAAKAAETLLVQIGGVMPKDMERALKASADLAAVLKIDLSSAAMMVAKAAEGQTGALSKAGVVIAGTKDGAADFTSVLDQLEAKLHGSAEAAGTTFAGSLAKLENAWGSLLEATGRVIVNNATFAEAVKGITELVADNTSELNENATANNLVSDAVILVAEGLSLGLSALDFFQAELKDARFLLDAFAIGLTLAYEGLQQLELATQKPLAWAGSEEAAARVREAGEAMEWARGQLEELRQDMDDAKATSAAWSAAIGGTKEQLDALIERLKTTRGETRGLKTDAAENDSVWKAITENMKANAEAQEKAAKAAEAQREALAVLASVSEDFHQTVAALNPELVEQVKNYLASGVAADTLAKAYGLTSAQIGAVSKALAEEAALLKQSEAIKAANAKLELEYWHVVASMSHDSVTSQIDEINAWAEATKEAMKKAKTYTEEGWNDIKAIALKSIDAVNQKQEESIPGTKAYYQKIADVTEAAYQFALKHMEDYTAEALIGLQDAAEKAKQDLADWQQVATQAAESVGKAAKTTASTFGQTNEVLEQGIGIAHAMTGALDEVYAGTVTAGTGMTDMLYAMQHLTSEWVDMAGGPGGGWIRSEGFGSAAALNRNAGYRAAGGPVAAGASYVVGERGPELFTPGANGMITPSGGSSVRVVLEAGALTLNYPIVNDPRALDALARTVGDAILSRVTRAGARL
jgi:hypothetical protein